MFLNSELNRFIENHPNSAKLWEKSIRILAGGISHNIRNFGLPAINAFPVFVKSANGSQVTDVDKISYTDYWLGHYAMILGHNNPVIRELLHNHIDNGWHWGFVNEYQVELAERLIVDNQSVEKLRFCTSGTEATMYASRLARAYTGKKLIAKAKMGWHGANDTLFYNVRAPFSGKESPGLLSDKEAGILTYNINDESVIDLIRENRQDLAAVICEPVLGGGGGFPADPSFLKLLRQETEANDILLIFDEVITGYRYNYGLFQNSLNIFSDLTTMGKIVGGGMPIGIVGGRDEIIEQANPLRKDRVWIGGGTFSSFPLSMLAGFKTLELLKQSSQEYKRINGYGEKILNELNSFFQDEELRFVVTGYKSLLAVHVLNKYHDSPTPYEIIEFTDKKAEAMLNLGLLNRNITSMHGIGSLGFVHEKKHVDNLISVLKHLAPIIHQS